MEIFLVSNQIFRFSLNNWDECIHLRLLHQLTVNFPLIQHKRCLRSGCGGIVLRFDNNLISDWMVLFRRMVRFILSTDHYEFQTKKCGRTEFWFSITEHRWIFALWYLQLWIIFLISDSGSFACFINHLDHIIIWTTILFELIISPERIFTTASTWPESCANEWCLLCGSCNICYLHHNHTMFPLWGL